VLSLLTVDDEPAVLRALRRVLSPHFTVHQAADYREAVAILQRSPMDIVISDCVMPGPSGLDLLTLVAERYPATVRVMLSAAPPAAVAGAIRLGVVHRLLVKPWDRDLAQTILATHAEVRGLADQSD